MTKPHLTLLKIGGKIVDDNTLLEKLLNDFSQIPSPKILVHGGGKIATQIHNRLGIEAKMHEGRRITDKPTLEVVTMVYGGLANKNITAQLIAKGVRALGVTGADLDLVRAQKRKPEHIDFGYVGDVTAVNANLIAQLLSLGITPVFAPLTHDGNGTILNTNADTMVQEIAVALSQYFTVDLVYSFEKKGVLANPDDDDSYIHTIDTSTYEHLLKDGIISGGMIPKMQNAYQALHQGVASVIIMHADYVKYIGTPDFVGTKIIL